MRKTRAGRVLDLAVIGALGAVVLLPVLVVFEYAFATKWFSSHWWWPQEFGTKWFFALLRFENIVAALINSGVIATLVAFATIAVTFPAAYVFGARSRQGPPSTTTRAVEIFANLPLAFPTITLGISLLPLYGKIGLLSTLPGIVLAHMIMAVPYALRAIVNAFLLVPPEFEEAARNLGASRVYILRRVYLPLVWPGVVAGGIFAFSWSLNEFVLVLLLGYPNLETIPVQIYQFVGGYYLHPQQAAALGLFLMIPTFLLMFVVERALKSNSTIAVGG
jgi:ABC-type spermidine/putrescine transport system permease subunit II